MYRDFNLHIPDTSLPRELWVKSELEASVNDVINRISCMPEAYFEVFNSVNVMIFNHDWLAQPGNFDLVKHALLQRGVVHVSFTCLANLDLNPKNVDFGILKESGVDGVKFHSYVQKIGQDKTSACVDWAHCASGQGLFIAVDCSYGSQSIYAYDNLRLVNQISSECCDPKLIILHSGGARLMDAMLLCLSYENIQLDMSFSVPFYKGFTLFNDFSAAYHKIGWRKVLFGTDYPYVKLGDALDSSFEVLRRTGFSETEVQNILVGVREYPDALISTYDARR